MTMKIRLRLVYTDGDAAVTLMQPRRWSYAFVTLLYRLYIKSEVLIYFQLNFNDRRAQVAMLQLAIMNHKHIMLDDLRSRQEGVRGPKSPGSVHFYLQTDGYNMGTMINSQEQ